MLAMPRKRRFGLLPNGRNLNWKNLRILRHHGVGATTAVSSEEPHRLQNRRVGGLPSPQFPQIRSSGCSCRVGGATSGWGVGRRRSGCGVIGGGWGLAAGRAGAGWTPLVGPFVRF
jgi:hypothetical protein